MPDRTKFVLDEREMPTAWYNVLPDLPKPLDPPLHPVTGEPMGPEDLAPLFPMGLIAQEVSQDRYIDIPEEVLEIYKTYRPSPLVRAKNLEKALDTPAKIYFKYEGVSAAGSHKPNTAYAQAYYNKAEGINKISTETGAGQWGSALAIACKHFDIECKVYMVKVSYGQKPYRRILMETYGASVTPSPSTETDAGKAVLAHDPDSLGSLGIAISEAVEVALKNEDTHYSLGSVLNHVCLHQTIVGQEAIKQMDMAQAEPDVVIGCVGGGSNFAGIAFPFYHRKKEQGLNTRLLAVEPKACPTLTAGDFRYDWGDEAKMAPQVVMYTLGHDFVPAGIHAGGLRYHGDAPTLSLLVKEGEIDALALHQTEVFEGAVLFAQNEGILPAPESAHAIQAAIREALDAKEKGEERTILFNLSGHGHFDLGAYDAYLKGELVDYDYAAGTHVEEE
jgi:tryptophan synthase beta chain